MLYPVIGNDENFVSGLSKEAAREQTWKERLRTECSAEARELRENPTAFSHPDPAGPTGTCGGIGAIAEALAEAPHEVTSSGDFSSHHDDSDRVTSAGVQGPDGACAAVGAPSPCVKLPGTGDVHQRRDLISRARFGIIASHFPEP